MNRRWIPLLPFAFIILMVLLFYIFGGYHILNFDVIQAEHAKWKTFVAENPALSSVYFIGIYTLSIVLVIPDSTFLMLIAGFLFPMPLAIFYVCLSETLGGTLFFLAARMAFGASLTEKRRRLVRRLREKYHPEQAYVLLSVRLSHLFPFWLINLVAGLFRVKIWTFVWTTCVGVIPFAFIFVQGGESLSKYFETHTHFSLREFFTPGMKIALIVLAVLSLLPLLYKRISNR